MIQTLYIDTETTGLSDVIDPVNNLLVHDIITLSGFVLVDGERMKEFDLKMCPFNLETVTQKSIDTHGITIEEMKTFPDTKEQFKKFNKILKAFVNPFAKKKDKIKLIVAGYNVKFDIDFLNDWFKKNGDNYLYSFIDPYPFDIYQFVISCYYLKLIPKLENFQLKTVCDYFGVPIKAHDSLSDINATRELAIKIFNLLKEVKFNV